ncbi:MAG: hypothetical protein FWD78_16345 [Treponema sp.]|nr:hypothetical protein [Treponema sp.]
MVKWRRQSKKDIVNNPLHRWLTWLDPTSPPEQAEEALKMDTTIQKAQEKQDYILRDEEALHHYMMQQMAYWDNISANKYMEEIKKEAEKAQEEAKMALTKGKAEGMKEGLEKSSMDIARRMKARGHPTDEIAEVTGLSRDVIEKL